MTTAVCVLVLWLLYCISSLCCSVCLYVPHCPLTVIFISTSRHRECHHGRDELYSSFLEDIDMRRGSREGGGCDALCSPSPFCSHPAKTWLSDTSSYQIRHFRFIACRMTGRVRKAVYRCIPSFYCMLFTISIYCQQTNMCPDFQGDRLVFCSRYRLPLNE